MLDIGGRQLITLLSGGGGDVIAGTVPGSSRARCGQIGVLTGVFESTR
jgi:hypothetical protein